MNSRGVAYPKLPISKKSLKQRQIFASPRRHDRTASAGHLPGGPSEGCNEREEAYMLSPKAAVAKAACSQVAQSILNALSNEKSQTHGETR